MGFNVVQKLIAAHIVNGEVATGRHVSIRATQVLAHDLSGPAVLSQFEQLGIERAKVDLAVFYVDHEIVPTSPASVERLEYMRGAARRFGAHFSRPGNGICHLVHLERFAVPGRVVVGADPHTQILGALGMLALAGESVEVAAIMAGEPYELVVPEVLHVTLHGKPRPFVSPKDIGLELIRRRGLGSLVGKAIEFDGPGARALGVYERATIAGTGPALGAVATVFPSDDKTRIFLQRQRRSKSWRRIEADADAEYSDSEDIELGALEPLALGPLAPGTAEVRPVRELAGRPVHEVILGSCTNASARDILTVSAMLRGKKVHPDCTFAISPGTRQALEVIAREGSGDGGKALADLVSSGARILESGCGPCVVLHRLPEGAVSVRTFAHPGCVPADGEVIVVSPETAAACAINGQVTDPRKLRRPPRVKLPRQVPVDDSMVVKPGRERGGRARTARVAAPAVALPEGLDDAVLAEVTQRLGHGARLEMRAATLVGLDPGQAADGGGRSKGKSRRPEAVRCLVAGRDLGYGPDGPEVASAHRRSGLRLVIAEGFAPPCEVSLANAGVVPLRFVEPGAYDLVKQGDRLQIQGLARKLRRGEPIRVSVSGNGTEFEVACELGERGREILVAGGLFGYLKKGPRPRAPASR